MQTDTTTPTIAIDLNPLVDVLVSRVLEKLSEHLQGSALPTWLDVNGVADYLSCSPERVRKLVASNTVPYHQERPGARVFFNRHEVDEWLLAQ